MITRFYINELNIASFRGLKKIDIKKCSDVNLILGDNNAGKTSFLESIYLLRNNDTYNFTNVAKCRQESAAQSISNVKFLYPLDSHEINIHASTIGEDISFYSTYKIEQITFDKNIYFDKQPNLVNSVLDGFLKSIVETTKHDGKSINQISGTIKYNDDINEYALVDLDFYGKIAKSNKQENKIVYMSPSNHYNLSANNISQILKNKNYHNILVELLRMFDASVEDIIIVQSDGVFGTPEINIRKKGVDESEPISLFGDGMKKAIALATFLVRATDGILLIDEVETSLHHSLFKDVFSFLLLAAKQFNVQLFIATHNIEAIDSILDVDEDRLNNTSLITFRNSNNGLSYRCLNGKDAKKYRENISMEVR